MKIILWGGKNWSCAEKKKSLKTSKEKNDGDIWIKNNETNFMKNENLRKVENKKPNIMEEILYYEKS